jgi:hypothetical protein
MAASEEVAAAIVRWVLGHHDSSPLCADRSCMVVG